MSGFPATITRRSGRRSKDFQVTLEKPPEQYQVGDCFDLEIEGRTVPVNVEIAISDHFKQLYVA